MDLWTIYCPKKGWLWFKLLVHGFGRLYSIWTNMRLNVYNVHGGLFASGIILLKSCLENLLPFMIKYLNMCRCSLYKIKKHIKNEFIESFGQRHFVYTWVRYWKKPIFGLIICWKRCMLFHNLMENCKVISIQLWVNDSSSVWRFLHFPIIFVWQTWFVAVSSLRITSFTARSSPTCPAGNWWTCSTLTLGTKSESTTVNSESCWTSFLSCQLRSDQREAVFVL